MIPVSIFHTAQLNHLQRYFHFAENLFMEINSFAFRILGGGEAWQRKRAFSLCQTFPVTAPAILSSPSFLPGTLSWVMLQHVVFPRGSREGRERPKKGTRALDAEVAIAWKLVGEGKYQSAHLAIRSSNGTSESKTVNSLSATWRLSWSDGDHELPPGDEKVRLGVFS